MFRPPLLNMDAVQEKNTFLHVPGTPQTAEAFQPLRTTPASFAPPNVLLPHHRKRPEPIEPVIEGRPMNMEAQKVNLPTMNSLYTPVGGFFGETPTAKGLMATSLKLADFVTTPKPTSITSNTAAGCVVESPDDRSRPIRQLDGPSQQVNSYSNPSSSMSSPHGYHNFANSSSATHSSSAGGYLPMYNSAIVNSLTPTTHISVHPVPNISWSQSVEIALAAESAKISAPYTAVGKSLTRTALMA